MSYVTISVPANSFTEDEISTIIVDYLQKETSFVGLAATIVRDASNEELEAELRKFAEALIVKLLEAEQS